MTTQKKPRKTSPSWRDALRILLVLAALLMVLREDATPEQFLRLLEVVL